MNELYIIIGITVLGILSIAYAYTIHRIRMKNIEDKHEMYRTILKILTGGEQ